MRVPFVDLSKQELIVRMRVNAAFKDIIDTGRFVSGKYVEEFEKAYAEYIGVKYCVCVSSGTAALTLSLMAYGVGKDDEVIVPANTFVATAEAVSLTGATPVFADIDEDSFTISPESVKERITPKTRVIIPVHLYGQCADMTEIRKIARKNKLVVVEDSCQAHGATYKNKKAGSLGDCAAFSFYPSKNLGCFGEGGCVTTNDDEVAGRVRLFRNHGSKMRYRHELVGGNFRMSELQGAALNIKLPYLDEWNVERRRIAEQYAEGLKGVVGLMLPKDNPGHVYHLYVIRTKKRDELMQYLKEKDVETMIHYPTPLYLTEAYFDRGQEMIPYLKSTIKGLCPISERVQDEVLSLPLFPGITTKQIHTVTNAIKEVDLT